METEQKSVDLECICGSLNARPSSKCLRKNGFYRRGRNKVQRYRCIECGRVFSFPPKKKRQETRGRPFKLLEKPKSQFKNWEDYYLIQIIGKFSILSGRGFYEELWDFAPFTKKELAPKISRNIKFSSLAMCRGALAYLNKYFPLMCKGDKNKYFDTQRWISSVNFFLLGKVYEEENGKPFPTQAGIMARTDRIVSSNKQQPLFVKTMLCHGVFGEFDIKKQSHIEGLPRKVSFVLDDDDFFQEYFYGR